MPQDDWLMGSVAAQDTYNPGEGAFQAGIRATPWFDEFTAKYGEPNLNDPNYDYRAAWAAGARPTVRDPGDQLLHWPSQFKGENHPNRYVGGVDTRAPGALAATDVYSAFDVPTEQSTNVGWANRLGEILTTRPTYDEQTVLHSTASPLVQITEGDIGRATEAAMGVSGGGMTVQGPKGIRAYHSSPHDFDKFDLAKIGAGEGAQAYGHGLYFAESPAVSGQGGQYWQQFRSRFDPVEASASNRLQAQGFSREKAIADASLDIENLKKDWTLTNETKQHILAQRQAEIELLKSGKPVGPRTYEVNINADPAHMLDWDKPLFEQGKNVQDALAGYRGREGSLNDVLTKRFSRVPDPDELSGARAVQAIQREIGPSRTSATLNEAGIPGIKYLDQGSRAAGTGSSNYVVFDPGIIDIMKKYGIAGAAPAGMGALAAQDRYQQ